MVDHVIEFKDIFKSFQGRPVLQDINFQVNRGEFLTLLGPSGCGKTTLLRLISGFEQQENGSISIDGQDVKGLEPSRRHVNTVFQSYALFPHLTVFDNVAFGLRCHGFKKTVITHRVGWVLGMVKLNHLSSRKPHQLSGGEQQRVAIARAVVNEPLVLLLDEPFSSLDYHLRKSMQLELKQIQKVLGITFIFVTHDQEEALSMADRVIVMNQGKIEQIGTPWAVYKEPLNLQVARFIGEANVLDIDVIGLDEEQNIKVMIEGQCFSIPNRRNIDIKQPLCILIRPENIFISPMNESVSGQKKLLGTVVRTVYKGPTMDITIKLSSGKCLVATQFFNFIDKKFSFHEGEVVGISWTSGGEIMVPYEA